MATNSRHLPGVTPEQVFDVLRDGWSYGRWVVGTRTIRAVEEGWPRTGTCLHYTVGYRPFRKDDRTVSVRYEPDHRLALQAQAWPAGTASVVLLADPVQDGTTVTLYEAPDSGLAVRVHNPVLDQAIKLRNVETLRRLEREVRRRAGR